MSLMLSGYIISSVDLSLYTTACGIIEVDADTDALFPALNKWLKDKEDLPLLRRIQPHNIILLPTRAITGARFKFEQEDRDTAVKSAFLALCPNTAVQKQMDARMKFVTIPNPFAHVASTPRTQPIPSVNGCSSKKRDWSEM